jgi:hypothetical protein
MPIGEKILMVWSKISENDHPIQTKENIFSGPDSLMDSARENTHPKPR